MIKASKLLAEWVSLILSIVLLLLMTSLLIFQIIHKPQPYVQIDARLLLAEVHQSQNRYIVPLEVKNVAGKALTELKMEVTYADENGKEHSQDLELTYLSKKATQKVYIVFEKDPHSLRDLRASPLSYRLE